MSCRVICHSIPPPCREAVRQALLTPASDLGMGPSLGYLRTMENFWYYFQNAFFPRLYPTTYEGSVLAGVYLARG